VVVLALVVLRPTVFGDHAYYAFHVRVLVSPLQRRAPSQCSQRVPVEVHFVPLFYVFWPAEVQVRRHCRQALEFFFQALDLSPQAIVFRFHCFNLVQDALSLSRPYPFILEIDISDLLQAIVLFFPLCFRFATERFV
jgi:hypothetical protein